VTLVVQPARPGLWIDVDFPLTPARLETLKLWMKVEGIYRYGPLPNNSVVGDISAQEAQDICGAGYQLGIVGHPLRPGWVPSENLGAIHEEHLSAHVALCGLPAGMHLACDIEGTAGPSYGYGLTWAANRVQRGGKAQCYYGYQLGMTLEQCAEIPDFDSYWSAFNQARLPERGAALVQGRTVTIPGVGEVDIDTMAPDLRGEMPLVCGAGP
jgi:hypothetical protein